MKRRLMPILWIALALSWALGGEAQAGSCTPGTDCYCDRVRSSSNPIYDANLLMCEDFEAPTLRLNTGSGNGTPYYGPPYDIVNGQSSGSCNQNFLQNVRGCNSYWVRLYPGAVASHWSSGQPTAPTVGVSCSQPTCPGMIMWHPTDLWDGNGYVPKMAIYSASSDFTAEGVSGVTAPTNAAGGGTGIFDGNAILTHRVPAGQVAGILGESTWSTATEVGLTMAIGYPGNATTAGIWGTDASPASWKHNEWKTVTSTGCGFDGLFVFYNQNGRNIWPFAGFIGSFGNCIGSGGITGGVAGAYCASIVATVGTASCIFDASGINWRADTSLYQQTRDFPYGTYGCVRGHMSGIGTTSSRMRIWFTPTAGPNLGTELLILDFTYNDDNGSNLDNRQGYTGLKWNAYSNTNQGGSYIPSTATVFRYEDNVHIRAGTPVSCSQIGFTTGGGGGGPDTTPPAMPTGVRVAEVD